MKKITLLFTALIYTTIVFGQAMSGIYKVGIAESAPNFTTFKAAIDAVNTNGVSGDVLLEITSDLTEPVDISLGVNMGAYKLTIKPATGLTPTVTFQSILTTNIDGHFVIGSPTANNTNLIPTDNIVFDGSNSPGGTSKDLTIVGATTSVQKSIIRIFGNNDNIVIKNCIITNKSTSGSSTAPINVTNFNTNSTNYLPDNLLIENNTLNSTSGNGSTVVHISNSGTPTAGNTGLIIRNNTMFGRQRGMYISYTNAADIYNNTISEISQASQGSAAITLQSNFGTAGTFNIYNNRIVALTTLNATAGANNGVIGIDNQCISPKIVNIYNNMISGIGAGAATTTNSRIYGIRITNSGTSNVYNNTILIPEGIDMTTFGSSSIAGIAFATAATTEASPTGNLTIKNNIIISNETGSTMKIFGIRRVGVGGTFTSDFNNIYANSSNNITGYYNNADAPSMSDWQTASNQDPKSISKIVNFVSPTDLLLTGSSIGDKDLAADAIGAPVLTDILGVSRNTPKVYMGAHEATNINSTTNVENIETNTKICRTANGINVIFDGNANIELYTIGGVLIERTKAYNSYDKELKTGIYIIRINGKSIKFVK